MIKKRWKEFEGKIDNLSLRERLLIFLAVAFLLVTMARSLFLEPMLDQQKKLSTNVSRQQELMKGLQAEIDASLRARKDLENSAQQHRLDLVRRELAENNAYLQHRSDSLVPPEKMAELLEQVLYQNGQLKLVKLQTLPVAHLVERGSVKQVREGVADADKVAPDKQVFKHGVVITVRGSYLDLLQYLTEIEKLPTQMFWGKAEMKVLRYPEVELSLTVYTLSLEKTWLQV